MGKIAGLLFFQGEADAIGPTRYAERVRSAFDYTTKFSAFVHEFRNDVSLSTLPVVFAQIGTNTAPDVFVNWNTIKTQQKMSGLPCSAMVTTDDLPLKDEVHFTTESYQIIGQRYAEALVKLKTQMPHCG